ncbi:hypothetical protein VSDG_02440 [Cytospora chrysosperma]|uniref:Atos-like conserved domain-containing protein n=1 Tax=Cytospora chrysosperma TaxID=252740 RepID=A0A423WFB4_CYTCH|nr:hypothetical protein VSDG_02440 [Valsa sordida]
MPIFQETLDQDDARVPPATEAEVEAEAETTPQALSIHERGNLSSQRNSGSLSRRISEESIRTELCDGPIPDSPPSSPNPTSARPELASNTTSDRIELIERLKRGESPTWSPKRHLESLFRRNGSREHSTSPRPKSSDSSASPTVQHAKETSDENVQEADSAERVRQGLSIERPSNVTRRQALGSFHSVQTVPITAQRIPTVRHEGTYPYQAHQPRRSLTSVPSFPLTGLSHQNQASLRRPSIGFESSSPLHQTSMVGSYEESILRGRMSTTPSKPLDFLAQIGVLGLGNCKSSLRCPTHVTLHFPAVFYSYASTSHGRSKNDDGPSPYVGQIDLENGLPSPTEASASRRKSRQQTSSEAKRPQRDGDNDMEMPDLDPSAETSDVNVRKSAKQKRRSNSPKAPPGGSYRIPEKGQIQIIIKNQNKTAVKLFLVPYDLAGMEPGTKTFIRQRSYTAGGPIIENVPNTGNDKPALRYLAHLHVCCPARGRYYLYKSIRVVFANRVPDGKEKLRNEVTLPEPRFTPYKPIRVMHHFATQQTSGPGASLAAEKAFRRRSSGFSFGQHLPPFDPNEPMPSLPQLRARASSVQDRGMSLGRPIGSGMASRQVLAPKSVHAGAVVGGAVIPPLSFTKGEVGGYVRKGVNNAEGGGFATAEGLLSLRLRSLGMQNVYQQTADKHEEGGG